MMARTPTHWKKRVGLGVALGWAGLAGAPWAIAQGEINLTAMNYFQNFDSLGTNAAASLPPGFKMTPSNILSTQRAAWTNTSNFVTTVFAASAGTPTNSGPYNWGAAGGTDRAPGFMTATNFRGNNGILAGFTNNTGDTITQITVDFAWEQYRSNTETATNLCYFSLDGRGPNWGLPLASNVFPGTASAHGFPLATTAVHFVKGGLAITNGGRFYLLFYFTQPGLKGEGWAVDDLSVTLQFPPCPVGEVVFSQQPWNYVAYEVGGFMFDDGPDALGMLANGRNQRIVGWRNFRTDGNGGGNLRRLQPGDRFRISLSGWSSNGVVGCALNDGALTGSWDKRTNNTRGYIECGPGGDLAVTSQGGKSGWPGIHPRDAPATLEFHILSSREFTANIVGQTPQYDLTMLNNPGDEARIDGFSIYAASGEQDGEIMSAAWMQETAVTNLGLVEFGADGGTRTIMGRITDGSDPTCPGTPSPNRLVKSGAGTVTLGNTNNTYTLDTEITAGMLRISADACLGAAPGSISNAHIQLAGGAALAFTESFMLNANRGLAIGSGTGCLAVAEARTAGYAGAIGGPGSLAKDGAGTLMLSGHSPLTNATTVLAGTLVVSGSLSNSAVAVSAGATLAGTGTVGDMMVSGLVDPSDTAGAPGMLACGALVLVEGGALGVDLAHATGVPGADWDLIAATGPIGVHTSGTFTIHLRGAPADFNPAQSYRWKILGGTMADDFPASRFTVDSTGFLAPTNGGTFSVTRQDTDIVMDFAPDVPPDPFRDWLQELGLDPEDSRYAPDADDDRDGRTTRDEFAADTHPALSGSVLRVTGTYSVVERQLRLEFPASSNRFYQLVYATNLAQGYASSNLGPGMPGMVVTNEGFESWFGGVRALLTNPLAP